MNNDPAGIGAKAINDTLKPLTAQYNAQSLRINEIRAQNDSNTAQQRCHQNRAQRQLAQRNF